jgi:pantothenate kinase-related protein Tda10
MPTGMLPTTGPVPTDFDAVFVEVSLVEQSPGQSQEGLLADVAASITERHSIWEFLERKKPAVLAVLGVPGGGKTTLLRHVSRRAAQRARLPGKRTIPVLLELRTHADLITTNRHRPCQPC